MYILVIQILYKFLQLYIFYTKLKKEKEIKDAIFYICKKMDTKNIFRPSIHDARNWSEISDGEKINQSQLNNSVT